MIKTQQRNLSLDSLRGLMLIIITINHTSGPFHRYTYQTFGFVSAAEGFIFLSGILLGLVNGKRLLKYTTEAVRITIFRRTLTIYIYHLATLLAISLPLFFYRSINSHWNLSHELFIFLDHPIEALLHYSFLLYQPTFLDILPMYVIFIFWGFFALVGFNNDKAHVVLAGSFLVWLLSQISWLSIFQVNLENYPFIRLDSFNPFSWQLLFTIGCYLGYCGSRGKTVIQTTPTLTKIAFFIAVSFFIIRHFPDKTSPLVQLVTDNALRYNLGIVRLINFAVIAYLIQAVINSGWQLRSLWLETLGQHSLQVFTFQIIFIYYISPFRESIHSLGSSFEVVFQLTFVAILIIPALAHKYLRKTIPSIKLIGR